MSRYKFYKRSRKKHNEYYKREQLLNRKIRKFQHDFYNLSNPPIAFEYHQMDALRKEIKHLFGLQEYQVWQKSYNRKHAYFSQLSLFKSMYMMWKRFTYFVYLEEYHQVPHHIAMWAKCIGSTMVPGRCFGT
ncbi:hypothetical protein [uncultured Methanobrevibacter sp.]|uniref:hypothetical protein n=1 Tax=uncultured Methanobrevibacter sp. TaxID=253161 RepID=UPI0025DBBDAB|nr:hypothetical protein [uncultured Methanobrevibacter sp.]MCI6993652.1 hypothetical protein [Methanobrevibacter sp.]